MKKYKYKFVLKAEQTSVPQTQIFIKTAQRCSTTINKSPLLSLSPR